MIATKLYRMCAHSWLRLREAEMYKRSNESLNRFLEEHMKKTCNVCEIQHDCTYVPAWGEPVRWNCPFFIGKGGGKA